VTALTASTSPAMHHASMVLRSFMDSRESLTSLLLLHEAEN